MRSSTSIATRVPRMARVIPEFIIEMFVSPLFPTFSHHSQRPVPSALYSKGTALDMLARCLRGNDDDGNDQKRKRWLPGHASVGD